MPYMLVLSGSSSSMINSNVVTDIGTILTQVITWITGNQFLLVFFTFSLIGVGISIFRSLKGAIKP